MLKLALRDFAQLKRWAVPTGLLIGASLCLKATPASGEVVSPTIYDVSGSGLHITYSTSGADGQPHFTFVGPTGMLSFVGSEIRTVPSPDVGTLVSVTLRRTVDSGSTSFTLVVPPVALDTTNLEAPIEIPSITTTHHFSVVPRRNRGQLAAYSTVTLTGTARAAAP